MDKVKHAVHLATPIRAVKSPKARSPKNWIIAFVVCNFNVDVGPEIELVHPADTPFSRADFSAITFNSFPEQQDSAVTGDLHFHFSIRNNSPEIPLDSPHAPHGSARYFFGSCIFRQEYDEMTKRSFNQKTLVLISNHDFPTFFMRMLQKIVHSGYISDPGTLEAAGSQIASWPPPSLGFHELPFLGSLLRLEIPPHSGFPLQGLESPTFHPEDMYPATTYAYEPSGSWENILPYLPSLSELYIVFEKMIICESVIVLTKNPQLCSEVVSCVLDFIRPVPYAGTVRPYLTMQSDFCLAGMDKGTPRRFVAGVTNPFLLKRLLLAVEDSGHNRPHVLYLDKTDEPVPLKLHPSQRHRKESSFDVPSGVDPHNSAKRFLKTDHEFVKSVQAHMGPPAASLFPLTSSLSPHHHHHHSASTENDVAPLIRRHFASLTAHFLAPFNRYFATGITVSSPPLSPGGNPAYRSFSETDFLASLSKHGSSVKFRGQSPIARNRAREEFYRAFCRSPNFYSWLDMKLGLEREASAGLLNEKRGKEVVGGIADEAVAAAAANG